MGSIDFFSMSYTHNNNQEFLVFNLADHTIISNAITPIFRQISLEGFAQSLRMLCRQNTFGERYFSISF
jgi:lipoprotein signal peptidase